MKLKKLISRGNEGGPQNTQKCSQRVI